MGFWFADPILDPKVLWKFFWIERGGPRSSTHVSKLGSDTRISNDLFIDKAFKEEPNCLFGPLFRNFADNSILTDPSHQAMKSYRDRDNIPETRRVA